MASAYQVIANMGVRVEPTMIHKIIDPHGKVVRDWSKPQGKEVLDPRQAWIMADILKDMTNPQGSFVFGPWTNIGRTAALKTGTTDNQKDVLAIGWIPERLTAVWMGNSDNTDMFGITSAMGPGLLWQDYMKTMVGGIPATWYEKPAGIVTRTVCVNPSVMGGNGSGELAGPGCPGGLPHERELRRGHRAEDQRDRLLHGVRHPPRRAVRRLAGLLQHVGLARRFRRAQLWPLQLDHLRLRAETVCRTIRSSRHRRAARSDIASRRADADTDAAAGAETDQEAVGSPAGASLSRIGPRSIEAGRIALSKRARSARCVR